MTGVRPRPCPVPAPGCHASVSPASKPASGSAGLLAAAALFFAEVQNAGMGELFDTARRQAAVTAETAHRPWPLPERPWAMAQTWADLLFVHWPVDSEQLRPQVPDGLELDLQDGQAWLGVTPFRLDD